MFKKWEKEFINSCKRGSVCWEALLDVTYRAIFNQRVNEVKDKSKLLSDLMETGFILKQLNKIGCSFGQDDKVSEFIKFYSEITEGDCRNLLKSSESSKYRSASVGNLIIFLKEVIVAAKSLVHKCSQGKKERQKEKKNTVDQSKRIEELEQQVATLQNQIKEMKKQASLNIVDWEEFKQLRVSVNILALLHIAENGSFKVERDLSQKYGITIFDEKGKIRCFSYWINMPDQYVSKLEGKRVYFTFSKGEFVVTEIK